VADSPPDHGKLEKQAMNSVAGAARAHRAYAAGPYGQIHYRRSGPSGTRSPLLLLHPTPGSGYLFDNFMAEMGRDRSVIAPDLPGLGMSDAPDAAPSITDYAAAMLELEGALGLGLFDIMGYHTGGAVAVEMARQQPEAVRKIVMIAAPLFTDQEKTALRSKLVAYTADQRAAAMAAGWTGFKNDFWRMDPNSARTWNTFLDGQKNPHTSLNGLRATLDYDLAKTLSDLTQPILVLNPDDDLQTQTPRAAALLKNGRVHTLPGWTHGFLDAKMEEAAAIVREFLDT
jgi:pimeloyl-ACP methyl ester carboxylesterase